MNKLSLIAARRGCDARVEHLEANGPPRRRDEPGHSICGRDTHWGPTRHQLPVCKQCEARASVMTIDEMRAWVESGLSFADFTAKKP